jgi:hypothetical protein
MLSPNTYIRFSDMKTEWLLLWGPFLCSSILTMVFSIAAWQQIGFMIGPAMSFRGRSFKAKAIATKRRRLLRIAFTISVCLVLNTIATLSTASKLRDWNQTADLLLNCQIGETWMTHNWEAYGLNLEDAVSICSPEAANGVQTQNSCKSDCYWQPSVHVISLVCVQEDSLYQSMEDLVASSKFGKGDSAGCKKCICDCPCSAFVQVQRPRFSLFFCNLFEINILESLNVNLFQFISFRF